MKFKKPIEVQAGISDGDPLNPLGISGYLLSSDGSNVNWVSPGGLSAETAEAIVQPIKANEALVKGDPLYIVGFQLGQDVNIVAKADSSDVAKMPVVGLADDDYANQAFGTMTAFGSFNGDFDTTGGTESWAIGDIIFVKPGGGLTNIKPGGTDLIQNVAIVSRVNSQTGELEVIALGRTNDVPNLPEGRLFVGTAANTSLASDVIYVDEPNGRVGIGTTTPLGAIQIGDLAASSPSTNQILVLSNIATTGGNSNLYLATGASGTSTIGMGSTQFAATNTACKLIYSDSVDTLSFHTNFSTKMVINGSGNVGIGTTNPGSKLEVGGEIDASGGDGYRINGKPWAAESSNNLRLGDWDGEGFSTSIFDDNSSEVMRVTGGNVGIGTTTPSEKLAVVGTTGVIIDSGSSSGALLTLKGDGSSYGGGAQINIIGGSQDYLYYATNIIRSPGTPEAIEKYEMYDHKWTWDGNMGSTTAQPYTSYAFKSQGSSQMVIYNNNVGIGTTSPQAKLQVNGGVQLANDTAVAWAGKVGTFRYRTSGNNSYVDMCMQTGASTYAWVNIVTNSW